MEFQQWALVEHWIGVSLDPCIKAIVAGEHISIELPIEQFCRQSNGCKYLGLWEEYVEKRAGGLSFGCSPRKLTTLRFSLHFTSITGKKLPLKVDTTFFFLLSPLGYYNHGHAKGFLVLKKWWSRDCATFHVKVNPKPQKNKPIVHHLILSQMLQKL